MSAYQIRFLKGDGRYGAILDIEAASDTEARTFVVETYGQRALELWRGAERLARRTSPAYERRLRNDPYHPFQPRFAAMGMGDKWERLNDRQFEAVGRFSDHLLRRLREHLAPYPIWVRAVGHAQAPPQVDQKVRLSVHAGEPYEGELSSTVHCGLWSRSSDGEAILEDCCGVIALALAAGMTGSGADALGQVTFGPQAPDGIFSYRPIVLGWKMMFEASVR